MAEIIELEDQIEKVILVGVSEQDGDDAEDSVAELAELVRTAGAVVVGTLIQKRKLMHPGTYVGTGKVAEIAAMIAERGATGIVCDDELSPAQLKNLEQMLDTKVMDRTLIILDIFAARATTSEGKIQVELAQLKYRLSRLTGLGRSMSRLGGGIGTRGRVRKAGDGQTSHQRPDRTAEPGIKGGAPAPRDHTREAHEKRDACGGDRRLHECRKVHTVEPAYRRRGVRGGQAVCHT